MDGKEGIGVFNEQELSGIGELAAFFATDAHPHACHESIVSKLRAEEENQKSLYRIRDGWRSHPTYGVMTLRPIAMPLEQAPGIFGDMNAVTEIVEVTISHAEVGIDSHNLGEVRVRDDQPPVVKYQQSKTGFLKGVLNYGIRTSEKVTLLEFAGEHVPAYSVKSDPYADSLSRYKRMVEEEIDKIVERSLWPVEEMQNTLLSERKLLKSERICMADSIPLPVSGRLSGYITDAVAVFEDRAEDRIGKIVHEVKGKPSC